MCCFLTPIEPELPSVYVIMLKERSIKTFLRFYLQNHKYLEGASHPYVILKFVWKEISY